MTHTTQWIKLNDFVIRNVCLGNLFFAVGRGRRSSESRHIILLPRELKQPVQIAKIIQLDNEPTIFRLCNLNDEALDIHTFSHVALALLPDSVIVALDEV